MRRVKEKELSHTNNHIELPSIELLSVAVNYCRARTWSWPCAVLSLPLCSCNLTKQHVRQQTQTSDPPELVPRLVYGWTLLQSRNSCRWQVLSVGCDLLAVYASRHLRR